MSQNGFKINFVENPFSLSAAYFPFCPLIHFNNGKNSLTQKNYISKDNFMNEKALAVRLFISRKIAQYKIIYFHSKDQF